MLTTVSLVNFDNPMRVPYLERSFGSFHRHYKGVRHLVFDSSKDIAAQSDYYKRFEAKVVHMPGAAYGERLAAACAAVTTDYLVFLPDDFDWIFAYPLEDAITQSRKHNIHEVKLTCRGQFWFSEANAVPSCWYHGARVESGEILVQLDDLFVSKRRWFKDFHEQFSLACNLINSDFLRWVVNRIPSSVRSPGQAEKYAYLRLVLKRYYVAYYKMWTPAFHFVDLAVEGDTPTTRLMASQSLRRENADLYNRLYHSK